MRKLFSALAVVLVFAMALTITASANTTTVFQPDEDGKYTVTYENTALKDAMVGMVVIEGLDPEEYTISDTTIKYIDQTDADENGEITPIGPFAPMAKTTTTNKYLVYVGGGELGEVKYLGTLYEAIKPTAVALDKTTETLRVGGDFTLEAEVTSEDTTATYALTWESDDEDVVTVDNSGKVTALAEGTAKVKVTVKDYPSLTATCTVTVKPALAKEITLNKTSATLNMGDTLELIPSLSPAGSVIDDDGTDAEYTWVCEDTTGLVTVANGVVTVGTSDSVTLPITAIITVTETNIEKSATCEVTVTAEPVGIPGDVDGSGELDVFDALRICQYLANWDVTLE